MASNQDMDTSNPAVFVNAELLCKHIGKRVRALIEVIRSDGGGGGLIGKSTDDSQIVVKGNPPISPTSFVEVIGIAESDKSIRAELWTNFGDSIDMHNYNQLCVLANAEFKHIFI